MQLGLEYKRASATPHGSVQSVLGQATKKGRGSPEDRKGVGLSCVHSSPTMFKGRVFH